MGGTAGLRTTTKVLAKEMFLIVGEIDGFYVDGFIHLDQDFFKSCNLTLLILSIHSVYGGGSNEKHYEQFS